MGSGPGQPGALILLRNHVIKPGLQLGASGRDGSLPVEERDGSFQFTTIVADPGWFAGWPDKEAQARRLRSFEPLVVPGLLQTEAYARAILSTRMGATREELDDAVAGRIERQRILEREHPPELWVILDEAVLRRPVGGRDVMGAQLVRLVEAGQRPNIAIQVVPFGAGAHEGLRGGAFIVADFDGAATVAYQDAASSGLIVEDAAEVEALAVTWDTLRLDALPRAASVSLITSVAEAM